MDIRARLGALSLEAKFAAQAGAITALFGPSGCGKTTLLRCIAGLEPAAVGRVNCGSQIWLGETKPMPVHRRQVAMVCQNPGLFAHLTVRDNLLYGWRRSNPERRGVSLDEMVALLDLASVLERKPEHLSGGEAQRVALGRALLAGPRLLMLDEPLTGLDMARRREIYPYLQALRQRWNIPVLYVTHSLEEVARLADQVLMMDQGRLVATGSVQEMLAPQILGSATQGDEFALLQGHISCLDDGHGLTLFECGDFQLRLPRMDGVAGQELRLQVQARDVSICLDRPAHSSILNILPATVTAIAEPGETAQTLVLLQVGSSQLQARISSWSCEQLGLKAGLPVFAQIKAAAFMH